MMKRFWRRKQMKMGVVINLEPVTRKPVFRVKSVYSAVVNSMNLEIFVQANNKWC